MATPPDRTRSRRPGVDLGGAAVAILIVVLAGIWIVAIVNIRSTAPAPMQLTYQELRRQVGEGNVERVVARGQEIDGTFRTAVDDPAADGEPRTRFASRRPDFARDDLLAYLEANGVDVTAEAPSGGGTSALDVVRTMLPFILIIGLFMLMMRGPRGVSGGSFGRTRARRYEPSQDDIRFADVAGIEEAKGELLEVVDFLRDPEPYRRLGAAMPRGVLLYGPPGTGKTLLARAVAGEAGVPFFSLSASEFVEMFVGVGASRVRDLFTQAKEAAPAIVFIDELDAIGRVRMRGASPVANDEREQTLNQILAELDGFTGAEGVVVLAATNRPEILDPALLRAGRFDRRVSVNPPDRAGREAILAVHTRGIPLDTDVELGAIAATTPGMVGADLRALVNEAALTAARRRHLRVGAVDFSDALERVLLGAERRIVITPEERARTAYHEAGHALLATLVPGAAVVRKVSIVPHGQALGVTLQSPDADRHGYTEEELRGRVVAALGGRAAEEVVFGEISTGAEDDLEQVARIVRQMVERWGMSRAVGPNAVLPAQDPGVLTAASGAVSEETRRLVDAEVRRIVDAAHEEALTLLRANRERLEALAAELLERETLDEADVRRIAGPPAPRVSGPAATPGPASAMGAPPH